MANISQVKLPNNSIYDIVPVINPNNTVIDASVHVGPYPLNENSLCMVATDGKLYPFVQTLGTGTSATYNIIPNTIKFRIGTDVFVAGKAYDGSVGAIDVSTLAISEEVDIRYSSRRLTGASGTSYSAIPAGQHNEIYMYISIQPEKGTFNPVCHYMDGYGVSGDYIVNILAKEKVKANTFCMFLGYSSSYSTYYKVWLSPEHPIYYCDSERNFIPYDTWRNNIQDTSISLIDTSIANIESAISSSSGSIYFAKTTSNSDHAAVLVSIPEVTAYYEGLKIALYYTVNTASTTSVTLKVNDLAAKRIYAKGITVLSSGLAVNSINYLCYVGTASDGYFILDRDIDTDTNTLAYRNPVAGYNIKSGDLLPSGERRFKAGSAIKAQLVFEGADNFIYSITQSDVSVNPDWGLAYWNYTGRTGTSALSVNEVIQQESLVISDTCIGLDTGKTVVGNYFPAYAWFKYTNNTIKTTVDSSVLHPTIPLATDSSNDTYVYVGTAELVDGEVTYLHMDLSNHDFITLGNRSASEKTRTITAINGRLLDGGGTSGGNYNNPVSGAGVNPTAAYALQQYDFVCYDINQNGLVPLRCYYDGTLSTSGIAYDWGLAFCNAAAVAGEIPPEGSILQQITLDTANRAEKPMHMYMFFDGDGILIPNQSTAPFPIFSGQASNPPKISELTPYVPPGKELTQIYIGTWVGDKFHIDLSNHDFITYGTQIGEGSNPGVYGPLHTSGPYISYINGRPFLGASGGGVSLDGQGYGVCNSHTGGGEPQEEYATGGEDSGDSSTISTPKSGDSSLGDSSSGDSSSGGETPRSGEWTGIVTLSGYDATANSVVAVYFPSGQTPTRNSLLNINSQGAYPIMLKGNNIRNGDIEADSIVIFMFDGTAYNVIAGYKQGDYELTTRKVQSISASSTSSQYPSARCMYNIIGNIEAALQAI